jgi:hypothetical protein
VLWEHCFCCFLVKNCCWGALSFLFYMSKVESSLAVERDPISLGLAA